MRRTLTTLAALCAACSNAPTTVEDTGDGGLVARTDVAPVPLRDGSARRCTEAAELVYVLSSTNDLYSFRPNLRQFTRIGPLRCPTTFRPNSMAIDRDAVAWVNYVDPAATPAGAPAVLFRVNTSDASCTSAPPVALPREFRRLGMGFSTAGADSADETLFVAATGSASAPSAGLARLDTGTGALTPIGSFTGALRGVNAELTGTGDGRLYGFFVTRPVQVAQIDKATARITSTRELPAVEVPSDWAFSFWGGAFYLYTSPGSGDPRRTSNVTLYRPSDNTVNPTYMVNVGFHIVGAGVSTCAPVAPPP